MSATQATQQAQNTAIPRRVIGAVVATGIMSFCGVIVETAMNITFPALMSHFGIGTSSVQWMTILYLLVVASITPLSAALKRRFRSRTLFLCANLLFLTGLVIDALAPVFPLLLLGRAIQGLGTSIALPLMFNIILQEVPTKRIGTMMGVGTLITAIGPAVGPTFGGLVATTIGWRFVFIILIPVLLISLVTGLACIPSVLAAADGNQTGLEPLDIFLMVLGFAGLIFGISNASAGWLSWRFGGALALDLSPWQRSPSTPGIRPNQSSTCACSKTAASPCMSVPTSSSRSAPWPSHLSCPTTCNWLMTAPRYRPG